MNISSFKFKKFLIATLLLLSTSVALAQENIISSVTIAKSKFDPKGYELNIDSSQTVQYKSYIDGEDNVYFELKNSTLSPNMGTIYDDVTGIDNLTVKQAGKNKVRIYLNGQNVKDTELVFVNSLFETTQNSAKKVTINRPISEYKSTTFHNSDLENQDDIQAWDDNSFNLSHLGTALLIDLKEGFSSKILIFALIMTIIVLVSKNLARKMAQESEPLIGLNNAKYQEDEFELGTNKIVANKVVKNNSHNLNKKIPSSQILNAIQQKQSINTQRSRTLATAQEELTRAHQKYQQYLQDKYKTTKKPAPIDIDTIKKGIALSQYQKSTKNPYSNQEVIKINKDFTTPQIQPKKEFTSPYIKRTTNLVKNETIKDKTNMKFLDSVTQIYERSGRGDLANGLKKSMTNANKI